MEIIKGNYAQAKVFTDDMDDYARAQLQMICDNKVSEGSRIRVMPDVHPGKVGTIGLTMTVGKRIIPNLLGIDIGCGMTCVKIKEKRMEMQKLDKVIRENIPVGFATRKQVHRMAEEFETKTLKCSRNINEEKAYHSLGTLGGGNHFIEVDKDAEGYLYLTVHSGSRHLGKEVTEYYVDAGAKLLKAKGMEVPHPMTWLEGSMMEDYIADVKTVQFYSALNIRKARRLRTLRGYGKGDVLRGNSRGQGFGVGTGGMAGRSLEDFYKDAISQGLEFHQRVGRGYLPAGLVEEIRALGMPAISWDVELAQWFEEHFPLAEKYRSYARPSRRQSSSPDIPRPRMTERDKHGKSRTFGVVIDTSGSMSAKMLGMALGSIASFAAAKEVPFVRVVFCDADAYDAGYLTPEDVAGRVEVKGRGGTRLQPGVDCLINAKDFPKEGPILIITDGDIESDLRVKREHAFLIPQGKQLPFRNWGKVFYLKENI